MNKFEQWIFCCWLVQFHSNPSENCLLQNKLGRQPRHYKLNCPTKTIDQNLSEQLSRYPVLILRVQQIVWKAFIFLQHPFSGVSSQLLCHEQIQPEPVHSWFRWAKTMHKMGKLFPGFQNRNFTKVNFLSLSYNKQQFAAIARGNVHVSWYFLSVLFYSAQTFPLETRCETNWVVFLTGNLILWVAAETCLS